MEELGGTVVEVPNQVETLIKQATDAKNLVSAQSPCAVGRGLIVALGRHVPRLGGVALRLIVSID